MTVSSSLPPVLILGGEANALSVVRDLGRQGITVYAMGEADSSVQSSRYYNWLDVEIDGTWFDAKVAPAPLPPVGTHIDVQGFVFWDPGHVDASWHSFSGWELHPLAAWRPAA